MGDEASMLAAYAGHAAAALDLLIALEEARQEANRAGALLSLAHELAQAPDATSICTVVAAALPRIVGCRRASKLLWDPTAGVLEFRANAGLDADALQVVDRSPVRAEDTPELLGMLTDRSPRVLTAEGSSPALRELLGAIGTTEAVAVPLLTGETFLGVAAVGWEAGEAPGQLVGDELARLLGVADQASTALQNARLLETVRHQASHDALTGLPNRRLYLDRLDQALATVAPDAQLGVLFCDLDRFKEVNDTLGHAAGDELLRQVAARLCATVRPGDTVGRLSGDEFALLLPGLSGAQDARRAAERVIGCFVETFRLEGTEVTVGTSVGIAVHDGVTARSAAELLREADTAMYRHKQRSGSAAPAGS
jgi:diguanylate cyclase (GGDEF)-like protein